MDTALSYNLYLFTSTHAILAKCALVFSALAYVLPVAVIVYVFYTYPVRNAFRFSVIFLATILFAIGSAWVLKQFFEIARPFIAMNFKPLIPETGFSYPSMHSALAGSAAAALLLAFPKRSWFTTFVILVALGIAVSRVMLGVHYFSDILTGLLLGFLCAYVAHVLLEPHKHLKK